MMRRRRPKKPRLTPQECRWLDAVHQNVVLYKYGPSTIREAASDCWDGWLKLDEVRGMVRQRLLRLIPLSDPGPGNGLLGDRVTVDLTDRAIRLFWPDRAPQRPSMTARSL